MASLGMFLLLGLLLHFAHAWRPRRVSEPVIVGILAFIAFLSLLLLVRHVHRLALALLAAGLAAQTARIAARRRHPTNTAARIAVGWPALLREPPAPENERPYPSRRDFVIGAGATIGVVALGIRGRETIAERKAIARIPVISTRPPDVLLVVLDTVRASSLSLHGYTKPTSPSLERLATQAFTFRTAIAWRRGHCRRTPACSRADGRTSCPGPWSPLDGTFPTLAEYLRDRGYMTAGFVANREYCSYEFGLSRGFVHYEDYRATPGQALLYTSIGQTAMQQSELVQSLRTYDNFGRKSAEQLTADFLQWHARHTASRPIFAFLNYWDAHDPYTPPNEYAAVSPPGTRRRAHGAT
jgi:hypothetical protein